MAEKPNSVAELFLNRIAETPAREAFRYPVGADWKSLTWKETGERVRAIACGLRALGLTGEQRVAIVSSTRIEWILADIGILCAGGATTTIYPSNLPDECAYIIKDSNTVMAFAEDDKQLQKLADKRGELGLRHVITFDGKASGDGWVLTLAELEDKGRAWDTAHPGAYEQAIHAVKKDALATLIYTSGTTGQPKGVELTHDCWLYTADSMAGLGLLKDDDLQYLWLPLAHSFGKVLEVGQIHMGFATAVDGRIDKLKENLGALKPTFVAAVPRIFEKLHNAIVGKAKAAGGLKWTMFQWAVSVGKEVSKLRQQRQEPSGMLALKYAIASKLVFSKIHALLGGRLRYFVSGSAPLSREMAEFFHAAGVLILEGYGLTETSAATFVNRPESFKFGTVGPPMPGTEVKIAKEDGEILIKGRGVMRGYHGMAEATRETLDGDGWLHTGDIGELDADGSLKITDRKKDLIKTSGGKYVAPQALEGRMKAICPYVANIVVHGNNRNFCSALISLDGDAIKKWAGENGLDGKSYEALAADDKVRALVQGFVDQLNKDLPSYETIKKFALLPKDLSELDGDLTPSLKLKRKVVEKKYQALLDGFYKGAMEG